MSKYLRVFFVSVAVFYALVLGWLVSETARISAAVPPATVPPFECCAPWVRGSAAVPVNAREFDRFESSDGSALSLRLVPSDGKTPALFSRCPRPMPRPSPSPPLRSAVAPPSVPLSVTVSRSVRTVNP